MKYIFYLLVLCLIFSLGMYIGIDRSEQASPVQKQVVEKNKQEEVEDGTDKVDRAHIVEEVHVPSPAPEKVEPIFLQKVAYNGEKIVKNSFDQLIQVTYAFVEGVF